MLCGAAAWCDFVLLSGGGNGQGHPGSWVQFRLPPRFAVAWAAADKVVLLSGRGVGLPTGPLATAMRMRWLAVFVRCGHDC